MNRWEYEEAYMGSFPTQQEIDESSCIKVLYYRVAYACPGADIAQIQRVELRDGTVLFIGGSEWSSTSKHPYTVLSFLRYMGGKE